MKLPSFPPADQPQDPPGPGSHAGHTISHQSWTGGLISPEQLLEVQGAMMWGWAATPIILWGCWAVGPHSATIGDTNTVPASPQCCTVREMRVTAPPLSPGLSLPESSSPGP